MMTLPLSRQPAYWPDGTLKHLWTRPKGRDAWTCAWCGRTKGRLTAGIACMPDEPGRRALAQEKGGGDA